MFQASVEQEVQESNVWSTFSNLWSSSCKWFVKGRDPSEFHLPLENQEEFNKSHKNGHFGNTWKSAKCFFSFYCYKRCSTLLTLGQNHIFGFCEIWHFQNTIFAKYAWDCKMWFLWKMWFWKCDLDFYEKYCNENFVEKNVILKMWILLKNMILKMWCEFC